MRVVRLCSRIARHLQWAKMLTVWSCCGQRLKCLIIVINLLISFRDELARHGSEWATRKLWTWGTTASKMHGSYMRPDNMRTRTELSPPSEDIIEENITNRIGKIVEKTVSHIVPVAAHLRGMRPTLTAKKDPLMLRRNLKILLLLLNVHYNSIMYFSCCAYIRIRI